MQIINRSIPKL